MGQTIRFFRAGETPTRNPNAYEIAEHFLVWLQQDERIWGRWIDERDIRDLYPAFCRAIGWPEAHYNNFLQALGDLTEKRRVDRLVCGSRRTWTEYFVSIPGVDVSASAPDDPSSTAFHG